MNYPVKELYRSKRILYELLMSAFFLCFGVNLLSTGLFEISCKLGVAKALIGAATCFVVMFFMARSYLKTINRKIDIKGFVVYDAQKKEIEIVPEYLGSVVMRSGIDYGTRCNDSIRKEWNSAPLVEFNEKYISQFMKEDTECDAESLWITNDSTPSAAVLNELLQYEMIQSLSRSIDIEDSIKGIRTKVLDTNTAPDFLKRNRFFAMITDIEECKKNEKKYGVASYSMFNARIPDKCRITISDDNEISVKDILYELRIKSNFSSVTSVPHDFLKRYLRLDDQSRYRSYSIDIAVEVKFKFLIIFATSHRAYINWIDNYLEHLNHYYSTDSFLERIQWNTFNTIASYIEHITKD